MRTPIEGFVRSLVSPQILEGRAPSRPSSSAATRDRGPPGNGAFGPGHKETEQSMYAFVFVILFDTKFHLI